MELSAEPLLLSTKLKIPAPRRNYIVRRALFEKLSACSEMSVVFVRGGAGTGKTTLLSTFIRETGLRNVGWLSLDTSNTDVRSFWLYFTAAVGGYLGDDDGFLELMRANPDTAHMEGLLTILINRLCGDEDRYLVLDDVHCIADAALVRTLEYFLGALPDNFHLFMLSREDPPVYLGGLAVAGRLLFLDGEQMRLTPGEGLEFLRQTLGLRAGEEDLGRLNDYAEGWIGGLQLAAAAGGRHGSLLRAGGGIAAEYLTREIIESLTREEQDFLTGTGFLSYFDAAVCARLFEGFTPARFGEMIATLTAKNLFIVCIDEEGGVYRYHNILSDYLAQRFGCLPEDERRRLRIRASEAYEACGDREEALRQACAARDYPRVMRIAKAMDGRMEAWGYLAQVPPDLLARDADLAAQCFLYHLGNFDVEGCRRLCGAIGGQLADSPLRQVMQFAQAYLSASGGVLPSYPALTAAQIDALRLGPVTKAMVLVENAAGLLDRQQYEEAEGCVRAALGACDGVNAFVTFFARNQLAQIYEETGRLGESLACYEKSKALIRSPLMRSGIGSNYCFGLAGVYMRRMELDRAEQALGQAEELIRRHHIHVDVVDMTLVYHRAEMKFLTGDDAGGAAMVGGILSEYSAFSVLTLGRLLYELSCAGRLSPELGERFLRALDAQAVYRGQPFMRLVRASILAGRGQPARALRETEEVLAFARRRHNRLRMTEGSLLKIRLLSAADAPTPGREAANQMREAVYYACPGRIRMPFYLERETSLPLLRSLLTLPAAQSGLSDEETAFIRDTLAACGGPAPAPGPDALSARETEVLRELARGITNREIAADLCISPATVKTHVLSIYGKLGVSSRMMAVKAARSRGLL